MLLRYEPMSQEQRQILRRIRQATRRAGLYRLDARARFHAA